MLSIPIFKHNIKSSYKILLVFMGVLAMYLLIMISMFDPKTQQGIMNMMELLPKELTAAMGMSMIDTSLAGFLGTYYYGFIILIFPMIFDIIIANKLVAKQVDRGSMAYLLSTTNKRTKVIFTQALFLFMCITVLMGFVFLLGTILGKASFPNELDVEKLFMLNLGAFLLHFAISGIAFLTSCLFNETRYSLAFGAGIPIGFFLMQMIANAGDKFADLKYATIFTLFSPEAIVKGESSVIPSFFALAGIGLVLYCASILVFKKRDLPL